MCPPNIPPPPPPLPEGGLSNWNPTNHVAASNVMPSASPASPKVNATKKSVQSGILSFAESSLFKKQQEQNNLGDKPVNNSSNTLGASGNVSSAQTQGNVTHMQSVPQNIHKKTTGSPSPSAKPKNANIGDDKNALLDQIRKGIKLRPVNKSDDEEAKKLPIGDDPSQKQPLKKHDETPVKPEGSASPTTESAIASDTKSSISKITILKYSGVTFLLCLSVS